MPSCAMTSTQNRKRLVAIAVTNAGDPATRYATTAVTASPANIQP